jgi:hypothetical protein
MWRCSCCSARTADRLPNGPAQPDLQPLQGQQSQPTASTGRTEDCTRPMPAPQFTPCNAGAIHRGHRVGNPKPSKASRFWCDATHGGPIREVVGCTLKSEDEAHEAAGIYDVAWRCNDREAAHPTRATSYASDRLPRYRIARHGGVAGRVRQGLSEAGYAEGQSVTIHYRFAEGKPERFPAFAAPKRTLARRMRG